MNIVLEGPDGGGKSTLATHIADHLGFDVKAGEGPPKGPGEINERASKYLRYEETVFDRHPCVSQAIYAEVRAMKEAGYFEENVKRTAKKPIEIDPAFLVTDNVITRFYASNIYIIYCRSTDHSRHQPKPGEDPQHLAAVEAGYKHLVKLYDRWAVEKANLIYRIGDDVADLCHMLQRLYEVRVYAP